MSQTLKEKMAFALITVLSALFAIAMFTAGPIVRGRNSAHRSQIRLLEPITVESDTFSFVGMPKEEIIKILGKPEERSADDTTFIYYRRVISLDRDQVVVVKFENGVAKAIDTNIN